MSDLPATTKPEPKRRRGEYSVSPRLQRALQAYADGSATTQQQAADAGGLSLRAFQRALTRQNVRSYIGGDGAPNAHHGRGAGREAHGRAPHLAERDGELSRLVVRARHRRRRGRAERGDAGISVNVSTQVGYVIDLRPQELGPRVDGAPLDEGDAAHISPVGGVLLD
jgi:hypothetical protein